MLTQPSNVVVDRGVMKAIGLVIILAAVVGCTKPNPNLCCTSEADCAAQGLSNDAQCGDGLLCRGNQCIAVTCSASNDCDASAPYCVDSSCAEACTGDEQCPGFGQSMAPYCIAGACVQCRAGVAEDCNAMTPVCEAGTCRGCKSHDECASGVCKEDGACASESEIAYSEPGGGDMTGCTKAQRCSLAHAVTLNSRYILLAPGTYTSTATITLAGTVSLIGGSAKPNLTRSTQGPIVTINQGDVSLERVKISGAIGASTLPYGYGIDCPSNPGARHLKLVDVDVTQNASVGVSADKCTVDVIHSTFVSNGADGISIIDGGGTIERSLAASNGADGIRADGGVYVIRNVFSYRNAFSGFDVTGNQGSVIEFCTAADNANIGIKCGNATGGFAFPNNISVRNPLGNTETGCTYPGSIISDTVTGLAFKNSETPPYDYHLTAGSIAIDAAIQSTVNVDYDGDARPNGAGRDVGADEFVP